MAGYLLGNVTENAVFAATVSWMKNFVFITNAGCNFLTALLTMYVFLSPVVNFFADFACYTQNVINTLVAKWLNI